MDRSASHQLRDRVEHLRAATTSTPPLIPAVVPATVIPVASTVTVRLVAVNAADALASANPAPSATTALASGTPRPTPAATACTSTPSPTVTSRCDWPMAVSKRNAMVAVSSTSVLPELCGRRVSSARSCASVGAVPAGAAHRA
ncbi:MAG: hypothetical protein IPG81_22600 [Sandaracinaceae bacterium]|nr:hypothetical protein [Sandaracinaceae bacterium]